MCTFSTTILTSKLGVGIVCGYICGYVEKYHICVLKVGVLIICACAFYVGIYGKQHAMQKRTSPLFTSAAAACCVCEHLN